MKAIVKVFLIVGLFASLNFALVPRTLAAMTTAEYNALIEALEATTPLAATNAPKFGSFYTVQHGEAWPPLPGNTMNLPYWDIGGNVFVLDDRNFSYETAGRFRLEDSFESDFSSFSYTSNDLYLVINGLTNDDTGLTAHLTIYPPWNDTNLTHDLLYTPNLNSPTNWRFLMRCLSTNVIARGICEPNGFFALTRTNGNLTVSTNSTALQLAQLLVPPGVTIANAAFTGALAARGTFVGGNGCGLPLDSGVILSTGPITNAIGPNTDSGQIAHDNGSSDLVQPGDADLEKLTGVGTTHDAAVLEFDIISTNSFTLRFQYIFASEEYPEFIGPYNDPLAIFVSTNRAGADWINNTNNDIALVPGTTNLPVSVNTINGGCASNFNFQYISPTNEQYYVDNDDPDFSSAPPNATVAPAFNIEYDGMTVLLVGQAQITAGVTNHIKVAIADYADHNWDSAVFIAGKTVCP